MTVLETRVGVYGRLSDRTTIDGPPSLPTRTKPTARNGWCGRYRPARGCRHDTERMLRVGGTGFEPGGRSAGSSPALFMFDGHPLVIS
ncbi:hypothetical protein CP557_14915 [Natrinema ejinorense]|uniref:Uncharacterized protein n=1 Tax=Natrinema ejinorense TaxID=373386 RepID=A0A2A5QY06_9EURY|nr:hypothetical protein CP557_14915 [Natrinema ejinorense]